MSPVLTGESPSCRGILSIMYGSQNLCFVFHFVNYFADILFLCVREPYGGCMHRAMLPVAMDVHIKVII